MMKHSFSVQMTDAKSISGLAINRKKDGFFLEGELGLIEDIELIEGKVLTIKGENGTIRIDISEEEILHALKPRKASE
ncbi:hypothetical protein E4H04_04120 [Candidatus Bathyarchaeota archaeon]|nr:hypothetical protein [Candidatus Bathyarchaeota archaeon]TFH18011.1 MAG: hypothetical protein E4H04_04120 [Candidatus Bathyarchaeota archaeon]